MNNVNSFHDAVILTGPTGSGKSALALQLAERCGAEIVSMDSMALYRGMDILSAKPTLEDRRRVPHHLIDVLDAWESASVSWWLERAAQASSEIRARGKRILIAGGTPLYLKALLYGLFEGPGADAELRAHLEMEAHINGPASLHIRLAAIDPVTADRLHVNDVRRIVRALEVWQTTGKALSAWQSQWAASPRQDGPRCFQVDRPREEVYARIDARVVTMFDQGLVEEVAALRALPRPVSREAAQAAGYREVGELLEGRIDKNECIRRIQTRTRQLAKRQFTWFKALPECQPITEELTEALWDFKIEGGKKACGSS